MFGVDHPDGSISEKIESKLNSTISQLNFSYEETFITSIKNTSYFIP